MLERELIPNQDPNSIYLNTGNGILAIERSHVRSIKAGFASRKNQLDTNDYDGHLKFAQWGSCSRP